MAHFRLHFKGSSTLDAIRGDDSTIAVCRNSFGYNHLGIVTTSVSGSLEVLHLAFHHILAFEPHTSSIFSPCVWVEPDIHLSAKLRIRSKIKAILRSQRRGAKLPYGVRYTDGLFDEEGGLRLGDDDCGLTCATFVIAIFSSVGLNPLDVSSWKSRPDDGEWHDSIVDLLDEHVCQGKVSKEHLENVRAERGCPRFRPEDVLAGGRSIESQTHFDDASSTGEQVVRLLDDLQVRGSDSPPTAQEANDSTCTGA